jgi:hypothetical protein
MTDKICTLHEPVPRLHVGDTFVQSDTPYIVLRVTDCNAVCAPITRGHRTFTPKFSEEPVTITVRQEPIRISANSQVEIVARLGQKGVDDFLNNKKKKENYMKLCTGDEAFAKIAPLQWRERVKQAAATPQVPNLEPEASGCDKAAESTSDASQVIIEAQKPAKKSIETSDLAQKWRNYWNEKGFARNEKTLPPQP